jgi:hypothetical protein
MIIITEDNIMKASEFFDTLTDENAEEAGEQFALEQPYLLTYLQAMAAVEREVEDPELLMEDPLAEDLNYYGMFIWKAFQFAAGKIPTIGETEVEQQSDASMEEMQDLVSKIDTDDPEDMTKHFKNLRQPVLFTYLLTTLFGDVDDDDFDEDFNDEESNYIFLVCNQVIQMLDHKVNGNQLKIVR